MCEWHSHFTASAHSSGLCMAGPSGFAAIRALVSAGPCLVADMIFGVRLGNFFHFLGKYVIQMMY